MSLKKKAQNMVGCVKLFQEKIYLAGSNIYYI